MKGFRLNSIKIDTKEYRTERIELLNEKNTNEDNYFSLIIGNNGTGKSRFLSSICKFFNDKKEQSINIDYTCEPNKIIAITHSISDKFPLDNTFRIKRKDLSEEYTYSSLDYIYLGTRNEVNSYSNRALMTKTIDILFENYSEKLIAEGYRHIFEYLGYEPIIKLNYKIANLNRRNLFNLIDFTVDSLKDYLQNKVEKGFGSFRYRNIEKILENNEILQEIFEFYNLNLNETNDYSILVNFSQSNIERLKSDNSTYIDKFKAYKILKIMRSIDLIRDFEIKVYKKGGNEFNFSEASSGESNILSTLIALIPLIQDNSLILIDEPEVSLHPTWQSQYIDLLKKIFNGVKGCHIIIATHSHFLVSDLPLNSSSVIEFKNNKNLIQSKLIESSTFGWSAEDILLNIFKLPSSRNFYLSQMVSESLELLANKSYKSERFKYLQNELQNIFPHLKKEDPLSKVIEIIVKFEI